MQKRPMPPELKKGGVILVDKPYKWTSFDAVNSIKISLRAKIGHCGTLDPLATGLLICCTGAMTKQISGYQQLPKEYTGVFHLGAITPTYDLESAAEDIKPFEQITLAQIALAVQRLSGDIMQIPPIHSAIKKDGKRSYDLARAGQEVILQERPVTVSEFEIISVQLPEVRFRVVCTTGTYIRSLAHDFGQLLGCGAHLSELRRTRIGDFSVDDALSPLQWKELWKPPIQKPADPAI
jgi:tRNA pseudouridine55 synthase